MVVALSRPTIGTSGRTIWRFELRTKAKLITHTAMTIKIQIFPENASKIATILSPSIFMRWSELTASRDRDDIDYTGDSEKHLPRSF